MVTKMKLLPGVLLNSCRWSSLVPRPRGRATLLPPSMWPGDEASTAPVLITGNVNAWHLDKVVYDVLTTNYCLVSKT